MTDDLLARIDELVDGHAAPWDIEIGWEAAQVATKVREFRALKAPDLIRRVDNWEVPA